MATASRELGLTAAAAAEVVGGGANGGVAMENVPAIATEEESPAEGVPAVEAGGGEAVPGDLIPVITVQEEKEVDPEDVGIWLSALLHGPIQILIFFLPIHV
jgi:hypothetical protein